MITRPLDLASKLRPEPRNFDWLFLVNGGLLVLFFSLFGSKFVLAPSVGVEFRLPEIAGANASAVAPTHTITVTAVGQILAAGGGILTMDRLGAWLEAEARTTKAPVLLVVADESTTIAMQAEITSLAQAHGFGVPRFAAREPAGRGSR